MQAQLEKQEDIIFTKTKAVVLDNTYNPPMVHNQLRICSSGERKVKAKNVFQGSNKIQVKAKTLNA